MMDRERRRELVQRYKDGFAAIEEAIAGISDEEMDGRPEPGEWTVREIIHHLADSETTSAIRLRLLVVEDAPAIRGYDQEEFARRLYYQERPIESSLLAFRAARETTAEILDRMSEAEWESTGSHSESGGYSVYDWLEIYAAHAFEHADQIARNRDAIGRTVNQEGDGR